MIVGLIHRILLVHLAYFVIGIYGNYKNAPLYIGQCKANCMTYFTNPSLNKISQAWIIGWITEENLLQNLQDNREKYAQQCFQSCDVIPKGRTTNKCAESQYGCRYAEIFFAKGIKKTASSCPAFIGPTGAQEILSCKDECISHEECDGPLYMCCKVGCRHECVLSMEKNDHYIPDIPQPPKIIEVDRNMMIKIEPPTNPNNDFSIIYVIQARVCECLEYDPKFATEWVTVHTTEHSETLISKAPRGKMTEFRVAAVSEYGSKGFSQPSNPFPTIPIFPSPPEMPKHVTEAKWRYESNFKVELLLRWDPPAHGDLTIREYNITWVQTNIGHTLDQGAMQSKAFYQKTIPATYNECSLDNLVPGFEYRVEIIAISYYNGFGMLKSPPYVLHIRPKNPYPTTDHGVDHIASPASTQKQAKSDNCECDNNAMRSSAIIIDEPVLQMDSLSVLISLKNNVWYNSQRFQLEWYPKICIDTPENRNLKYLTTNRLMKVFVEGRTFRLTNLKFHCKYSLKIRNLDKNMTARGPKEDHISTCFCTKACINTKFYPETFEPFCFDTTNPTPPEPMNLRKKLIDKKSFHYMIAWDFNRDLTIRKSTHTPHISGDKIKFRVTWGPRIDEPIDESMYSLGNKFIPILDEKYAQFKVIDLERDNRILLPSLKLDTIYVVKIQTLLFTETGQTLESPANMIFFSTPSSKKYKQKNMLFNATSRTNTLNRWSFILLTLLSAWIYH